MGAYEPTLGEIKSFMGPDVEQTSAKIDLRPEIQLASETAYRRMLKNERDREAHKKDIADAYESLDPSKLTGTLDSDNEVLMGSMLEAMDVLGTQPESLSNPNSEGYKRFKQTQLDFRMKAYRSKLRKLTLDKSQKLMDENPDFNTPENKKRLENFKNNIDADPNEAVLIPKMVSIMPNLKVLRDSIEEESKKNKESRIAQGDGNYDEVEEEKRNIEEYRRRADDLYFNQKYIDGTPYGLAYERDVYNNNPALSEKFKWGNNKEKKDGAYESYQDLVKLFEPKESVVTKQNRENDNSFSALREKSEIEAKSNIKEAQGKSNIEVNEYERKKKIDEKYAPGKSVSKVNPEILKSVYDSEAKAINESDLQPDEKLIRLQKAQERIYGPLISAFASVENKGKETPDVHKPTGSAFGAFGWIKDGGHLREAYNKGAVGGKYKSYSEFWKELHKGGDTYTDTLKQYADFLAVDVKAKTGIKEVTLADLLAYNLYGKAGVEAYRSGNYDYSTDGNMPVGKYVTKGLNAAKNAEGPSDKKEKTESTKGKWDKYKRNK